MNEKDIRPEQLNKEYLKLHKQDISVFFKDKIKFITIKCPSCASPHSTLAFQKNGFYFYTCSLCQTMFVNPRPNQKNLYTFYTKAKSSVFWAEKIFPATETARLEKIFKPRAHLLKHLLKKYHPNQIHHWLDVGSGYGTFLQAAKHCKLAKNFIAIEPEKKAAQKCRQRGFLVIEQMFEKIKLHQKVDIISMFELIEHAFNPSMLIKACYAILKKDGLLILTTPNIHGFDLQILKTASENISAPEHLNYFNPESIQQLLIRNKFQIVSVSTPGKLDIDIVKSKMLDKTISNKTIPFWGKLIIRNQNNFNQNLQKFLQDNNLSSHMLIIGKKK